MLQQEQEQHKDLLENRARELEEWGSERETSMSLVQEMSKEVEQLRQQKADMSSKISGVKRNDEDDILSDFSTRIAEMETEIRGLRDQNKRLKEQNEDLQAQMLSKGLEG